jgi:hypothetical protein
MPEMAGKIKLAIVAVVAVLGLNMTLTAATNAAPSAKTNRFEGPAGQFTVALPADWKPISSKVLQALIDPYASDHVAESGRVIQYGFGPEISDTVTNPPYLMIELNRIGRLPERVMALQSDKEFFQKIIARSFKRAGVQEYKLLETSYDNERHIARVSYTQIEPFTQSELRTVESVLYTQNGAVRLMAVCPNADWNTWSNTIETTLASVQIPKRLHYKARPALAAASQKAMSLELLLIFAVPLVSIIGWLILNRNCGEIMSDEI